jgi:hypothetical protein
MASVSVPVVANVYVVVVADDGIVDDVVAALEDLRGVASVVLVRAMGDLEELT